jgi:hypothetical protein
MPRSPTPPSSSSLLFAAVALAVGTHVASLAIGFLWSSWQAGADFAALTGVFFAPFCLLAVLIPLGTGPLTRRWFSAPSTANGPLSAVIVFAALVVAAELGLAALHAVSAPAPASVALPHVVLVAYALRAAVTLTRRSDHADLPPPIDATS